MRLFPFLLWSLVIYTIMSFLRSGPRSVHQRQATSPHMGGSRPAPRPATTSAYEVLGVTPQDSFETIKQAYLRLVQQYHPDRVADMGPELREMAERRTKEINAAYTELKRSRRG